MELQHAPTEDRLASRSGRAHHPNGLLLVNFVLNQAATFLEPRQGVVRGTLPVVLTQVGGQTRVSDVNVNEGSPHNAGSDFKLPPRI